MPAMGRSNEEIVHALHQVEGGEKVTEVCRRLGVIEQTFYRWKSNSSGWGCRSCGSYLEVLCSVSFDENRLGMSPLVWG